MNHIPILFSADMVNAILNGTKTQTRRLVRNDILEQRHHNAVGQDENGFYFNLSGTRFYQLKPKAQKGDIFWVRESWAARLFLEVVDVRLERLQDISLEDAKAEGIKCQTSKESGNPFKRFFNYITDTYTFFFPNRSFMTLWKSIHGVESWNNNPYVWVYEFKVIDQPVDFLMPTNKNDKKVNKI